MRERYYPPGRKEGSTQPIVEVTSTAYEAVGNPRVNYNKLDKLMRNQFYIPEKITPRVVLFGESGWGSPSFHVPLTSTIYINAARCEYQKQQKGNERLTEVLLDLSQQMAYSIHDPYFSKLRYAIYPGSIALEECAFRFAFSPLSDYPKVKTVVELATLGILTVANLRSKKKEQREQTKRNAPLIKEYKKTIVFPKPAAA